MGWCSATYIFDVMAEALLNNNPKEPKELLKHLAKILEDSDWDCQQDSDYWNHPVVQEIMKELHPNWFDK